jgi:5-methylcytosine-specific restriction enzyme A
MPTRAPRHRPPHAAPKRPSASKQGYGRAWERIARAFRYENPICADPFGAHARENRFEVSRHVDHIVPRSAGGTDEWSNLQALCARCHSRKTALLDGGFGRARRCAR